MAPRVKYPEGSVRTPEQILADYLVTTHDGEQYAWVECWNCGGSGTYPSSCTPPGMCRLYCWQNRQIPGTYGKLPKLASKVVAQAQAADRRAYRDELERPAREQAAREAAARQRLADEDAAHREDERRREKAEARARELAGRVHVGTIGERIQVRVRVEKCVGMPGRGFQGGTRYLNVFRTLDTGSAIQTWTDLPPSYDLDWIVGDTVTLRGTVKEHGTYKDEPQTIVQRVKLSDLEQTGTEAPPLTDDQWQRARSHSYRDDRENYQARTRRQPIPYDATSTATHDAGVTIHQD